jgi:hypothetical protein
MTTLLVRTRHDVPSEAAPPVAEPFVQIAALCAPRTRRGPSAEEISHAP